MSLTESQKSLILSVAQNDLETAKKWAIVCCDEDNTQKNAYFTKNVRSN